MAKKTKTSNLSLEERLEQALIPSWDEPYKLPSNWCWVKLDNITRITSGGTPSRGNPLFWENGNIPWVKICDISGKYLETTEEKITQLGLENSSAKIFKKGTLLYSIFATIGDVAILNIDAATNQAIAGITCSPLCNVEYMYYVLLVLKDLLVAKAKGVAQVNINQSILKETPIPLAPIAEQARIVGHVNSLFAKLDEAKEKAQEVVDGFETRKAAILHKAFSGKFCDIDISSNLDELLSDIVSYRENLIKSKTIQRAKLKAMAEEDFISCFPSNWKQLKLGEIAFITKLAGFEYTKYIKLEESGDVPVVRAQNVRKGYLDTTNLLYIDRQTSENLSRSALDKPSILITFIGAGIGDVCVFDKPQRFHLAPNVAKVEPYCDENSAINIKFLLYYLLSPSGQKEIFKSMKAVAQPSLSMETIRDIVVPFTAKEEQDKIVRIVERLIAKERNAKETAETVIEQIDAMKKAILARAFRGELGTNDPSEESALELLKNVLLGDINQQEPQKSSNKSTSIPNHIETALLTKLEKKIVSLFYITESKVVSADEIMSVSSKKIDIIDTLAKLEQRGILIKLNNSCYRIKE